MNLWEAASEVQAAREKQQTAEAHAAVLRKRSRILRAVLAVTLVIAAAAVLRLTMLAGPTTLDRRPTRVPARPSPCS